MSVLLSNLNQTVERTSTGHRTVIALAPQLRKQEGTALAYQYRSMSIRIESGPVVLREGDASIAPDLRGPKHNLEDCLKFPFGNQRAWGPGTPATIDAITKALKSLNVLTTGYCGVMLPVIENDSLAHAASRIVLRI